MRLNNRSLYSQLHCEKEAWCTFFGIMVWWVTHEVFQRGVIPCKLNLNTVIKDLVRRVFLTSSVKINDFFDYPI